MPEAKQSIFSDVLEEDEKILWEESPRLLLFDTEGFFKFDLERILSTLKFLVRFEIIAAVIVLPIALIALIFYVLSWPLKIVVSVIALLILTMKFLRMTKSKYAYSNKRIFISTWNWGKQTLNTFGLEEIGQISTEEYHNKSGILHFLPKRPFNFKTKGLLSGQYRHYPTFEFIGNIQEVAEEIRRIIKTRRGSSSH